MMHVSRMLGNVYNDVPKDIKGLIDSYLVFTISFNCAKLQGNVRHVNIRHIHMNRMESYKCVFIQTDFTRVGSGCELFCGDDLIKVIKWRHSTMSPQLIDFYNKDVACCYKILIIFEPNYKIKWSYGTTVYDIELSITKQMHTQIN